MDGPALQVLLGNVRAQCGQCRSTYFVPAEPGQEVTELTDLVCAVCETATTYAALVLQIGDEALRAARGGLREGMDPAGRIWPFSATCPKGHFVLQDAWMKDRLQDALKRKQPIDLYCSVCESHWEATAAQRGSLAFALGGE